MWGYFSLHEYFKMKRYVSTKYAAFCLGHIYIWINNRYEWYLENTPSKNTLAKSYKKVLFSCIPARSCKILQDLVGSCGILQESCRNFVQDSCKSHKILQDLARSCRDARKKDFSCKILQEHFYWVQDEKWGSATNVTIWGKAKCYFTTRFHFKCCIPLKETMLYLIYC